ncbi:MAG TPA: UDP-N-acetylmuramate dehydrogenase [Rhodanobacteraceae bacterium]|jgi:UDP-N-acetylmuramate dehydrogenase|nr:UDP-N-acetylmuramate dehydrogenase [Rhodanobacteraceae bacterium]
MILATAEGAGYTIVENASLAARNTFHVAARAAMLIDVRRREALAELFGFAALKSQPLLVLGEGSNILFTRDWPGVILSIATRGIAILEADENRAHVRVEAGENWNDFVHWSLARGFAGLENLAAIPGSVGAAPMQNIGAYGVEVREFIHRVEAWDRANSEMASLANADCAFAYRDSIFKQMPHRYVITAVEFDLPRNHSLRLDYAGVREELAVLGVDEPRPASVAEAITRIRMRKLPNPRVIGNAGSFFKNPLIADAEAESLRKEHPDAPLWAAGAGLNKISAAWLVESCGFKGLRDGDAGVSSQHALVLVNHGNASGAQIGALAERIQSAVRERFGIELQTEPLVV